jgi:hypothetical protein
MKKYLMGIIALIFVIILSAYIKPYSSITFKLLTDPDTSNIVTNQAQWSTSGSSFGQCVTTPDDIACKIVLNNSRSSYFHTVGSDQTLNTFTYADAQSPKQDYLEISEAIGKNPDRIITAITPKVYNTITMQYETASLGADLSYRNAKD